MASDRSYSVNKQRVREINTTFLCWIALEHTRCCLHQSMITQSSRIRLYSIDLLEKCLNCQHNELMSCLSFQTEKQPSERLRPATIRIVNSGMTESYTSDGKVEMVFTWVSCLSIDRITIKSHTFQDVTVLHFRGLSTVYFISLAFTLWSNLES